MAVVTYIDADSSVLCFEDRIAEIARCEIKLLPESRVTVRDMVLAILAQIAPVSVDHRRGVEINSGHLFFVNRNHNHHAMFSCDFLHHAYRRAIGNALGEFVPARILFRTKIRAVEKLLQAQDLCFLSRCLFDQLQVLVDHRLSDLWKRTLGAERIAGLNQGTAHVSRHGMRPPRKATIAEFFEGRICPAVSRSGRVDTILAAKYTRRSQLSVEHYGQTPTYRRCWKCQYRSHNFHGHVSQARGNHLRPEIRSWIRGERRKSGGGRAAVWRRCVHGGAGRN